METNHRKSGNEVGGGGGSSTKPKRQMKTPYQLETLENAYALEAYPSESMRLRLSEKLGLSDRQLQMWFCHRRLKQRKEDIQPPCKTTTVTVQAAASSYQMDDHDEMMITMRDSHRTRTDSNSEGSDSVSPSASVEPMREEGSDSDDNDNDDDDDDDDDVIDDDESRKYYESQMSIVKLNAIACVEAQLGEQLREDGPMLGLEFDPLPPDAFGAALAILEQQKLSAQQFKSKNDRHDTKSSKSRHDQAGLNVSLSYGDDDPLPPPLECFTANRTNIQSGGQVKLGHEYPNVLADEQAYNAETALQMQRKRKVDEAGFSRDVEAQENHQMQQVFEKQDIWRRKNEELVKKETEKQERERQKEQERIMRERLREQERVQREQKRENERMEKFRQKESIKAEKMKQKEELRLEREAVKRKIALEKATARKIAKDSMDLIEDEQLELMELAAVSKGLSSVIHLDHDTLQNLDSLRDSLIVFPPKSIPLKRPFAVQPWADSEENVGNLFMVWRFLIAFADVLVLWPFTLNEFVQAFHDYDSRLLAEIHIALLKLTIKDIEDVSRAPSTVLGSNQYTSANLEGGHTHIVEGAHVWGFDIRNWKQHLNQLTWPEVFRQLALSAGFGPRLKKSDAAWTCLGDNNEVKNSEDVVSTLRNGSAAEKAFTMMREKGLLLPRKSRHRLTPGTVKFAAFHVLSLEGGEGLTVIELVDKIQKSGLRDLTTSKTPEASISVALTRDTKLFERVAPSTYCARAAYRKDPADGEAIFAAARKKILMFENGMISTVVDDVDDVERDEELIEGDMDEDPDFDDLAKLSNSSKILNPLRGSGNNICSDVVPPVGENEFDKCLLENDPKVVNRPSTTGSTDTGPSNLNQENIEIDESNCCESWIQGLSEGEYSHLSVEERLNALVILVGVVNEGNSIRAVLEERMEASNALKKQMWTVAQLDKIHMREDNMGISSMGCETGDHIASSRGENNQIPLPITVDNIITEASPSTVDEQKSSAILQITNNPSKDNFFSPQQPGYSSKRSLSQLKAYIAHRSEELCVYRSLPLGQDRRRNRYWQFVTSSSRNDPCSGRIFVELQNGKWRLIDSEEAFDTLMKSLDTRGIRESHLRIMLQKIEKTFKENARPNMQCENTKGQSISNVKEEDSEMVSSPDSPSSMLCGLNSDRSNTSPCFEIELGKNEREQKTALERYQDFQKWIWKECSNLETLSSMKYGRKRCTQLLNICDLCFNLHLSEDSRCHCCEQTLIEEKNKTYLRDDDGIFCSFPFGIKLLKALIAFIEVSVPSEALESSWVQSCRKTWGQNLNMSSSPGEFLKILTWLEFAIKRNYLSSNYETTKELLGSSGTVHDISDLDSVSVLPWIPHTTAAVALKALELDASVMYEHKIKPEPCEDLKVGEHTGTPSRYRPLKNYEDDIERDNDSHSKRVGCTDLSSWRRDQGSGKRQKRTPSCSRADSLKDKGKLNLHLQQQDHKWGPRTVRRRTERRPIGGPQVGSMAEIMLAKSNIRETPRNLNEEWHNGNIAEEGKESDENAEEETRYKQRSWSKGPRGPSHEWNQNLMEMSNEDDAVQEAGDYSEGDVDTSGDESDVPDNFGNGQGVDSEDGYSD
ncbi:hypothetical protein ACFE04_020346 [Oxalis oulophora]